MGWNVDIVIAKTDKFRFHPIDRLEMVEAKSIFVVNIPKINIFPELWGKQNGSEH